MLPDWINIDYETRKPGIVQADLLKGLPFQDNSVDEILCSHFLEHLKIRHEAIPFLQECYRVLKPGGVMSFITPNFEILHDMFKRQGTGRIASATFGDGRTLWDYHISAWWPERYRRLGETGTIYTPAINYKVWDNVELVKILNRWRMHSPWEVTAIYRKRGSNPREPTWLSATEIVGKDGLMAPWRWKLKHPYYNVLSVGYSALQRLKKLF